MPGCAVTCRARCSTCSSPRASRRARSPITSSSGTKTSSRKISPKPVSPPSCAIGRTVTPSALQVEHEVGQALVALRLRIGPEQSECPLAERRSRTPDLLAVELPAAVGPGRGRAQRREVAARLGLRPGLRPDLLAAGHLRQHAVAAAPWCRARTASVRASRCRWRWPGRVRLRGSTPPRRRSTAAAWRRGRRTSSARRSPRGPRRTAPCPSGGAARNPRRCRRTSVGKCVGVGGEEVADLGPELLGRVVERQVHQIISRSCGLTTLPPGLRGSTSRKATDRGVLKFARCSRV